MEHLMEGLVSGGCIDFSIDDYDSSEAVFVHEIVRRCRVQIAMSFYFLQVDLLLKGAEGDVWIDGPTRSGIIVYSVITPIICCFGICGNVLSLLVLRRKQLIGSVYTYLAVLAAMDLSMAIVTLFGGLCRGILWKYGLNYYDALVNLPVGSFVNTLSVSTIVCLTLDRVIYLWNPVQCTKPKFCCPWVARRLMVASFFISLLFNLPYFFIFTLSPDGDIVTTAIFDSTFYKIFNWVTLFLFALIPAVILMFGNGFLILSLRRAKRVKRKANGKCRMRDHTNLTVTLVAIIIFFLISEIPQSLLSRTAATNLLFQGDHSKVSCTTIETLRQVVTVLEAINVTVNFVFYYIFCPAFCKMLKKITCGKKSTAFNNKLQVNVFVLSANKPQIKAKNLFDGRVSQKVIEISRKSIESALSINIEDLQKIQDRENANIYENLYDLGEYVDLNQYVPPFSTIQEETTTNNSTCSTKLQH
ncbi:probable G-protein coupled receptor B0563.6 [Cylas formicarius]|uniref:probable G-protein coupled receptor B0563.6 n=1 Tax=Cylas formicarius TaxID=197179 RepID=UPI0029587BD7|nr:probable G-protein coupled receptor B0563.6 [Cylas formicarius]